MPTRLALRAHRKLKHIISKQGQLIYRLSSDFFIRLMVKGLREFICNNHNKIKINSFKLIIFK